MSGSGVFINNATSIEADLAQLWLVFNTDH